MTIHHRALALAGVLLLVLAACAASPSAEATGASSVSSVGVDLGASSRVPRTQMAMAGAGHEGHRMAPASNVQPVHGDSNDAHATGTVNSVDAAARKMNMNHGPIPALGWPSMTMDFSVAPSVDLSRIKPGSRVEFSLEKGKDGMYQVQSVQPAGGAR